MTKKVSLVCIECPRGCMLEVTLEVTPEVTIDNLTVTEVTGNFCAKGKKYAADECVSPKRVVTSTMRLSDGSVLPVKTSAAVDKSNIFRIMKLINNLHPDGPVKAGDILFGNADGNCAAIVATADSSDAAEE